MLFQSTQILLFIAFCFVNTSANAVETIEENIDTDTLFSMSLGDLLNVDISLDSTFDIFDSLLNAKTVSVASGKSQEIARAPAVTSIITAQDIEAMGATTLNEALESVPGLHVAKNVKYQPVYVLRGIYNADNAETLVLINGEPFKNLQNANRGAAWRDMPVQNIARVEVIRGPGSALHGADAFAGTINIITKTAKDIAGTEVGARLGSFDTYEAWLLHGGRYQDFNIATSLIYKTTQGSDPFVAEDAQSLLDVGWGGNSSLAPGSGYLQENSINASLDVGYKNWHVRTGILHQDDVGNGLGVSSALDNWGKAERNRFNLDLSYHNPIFTPDWDVSTQINYVYDQTAARSMALPPGVATPVRAYPKGMRTELDSVEEHLHLGMSGFYVGFKQHVLHLGTGYRYQDLRHLEYRTNRSIFINGSFPSATGPLTNISDTIYSIYPEALRKNWYVFLEDTWHFSSNWDLSLGVRHDDYSDFGATTNPRASLVWQIQPALTAKLLYGTAFRAPSYTDLYLQNNGLLKGNIDLSPEQLSNWELAFDWRISKKLHANLNLFSYHIKDKLLPVSKLSSGRPLQIMENAGYQDGSGVEFELRWKLNQRASLLFNYAYVNTEVNHSDPGYYSKHQLYVRHDWLLTPGWYLDNRISWRSRQDYEGSYVGSSPSTSPQTQWDMTLRYKKHQQPWNISIGIRNLLNKDNMEPGRATLISEYPQAERNAFIEFRYFFE